MKKFDTRYKTLIRKRGNQENGFLEMYVWFRGQKQYKNGQKTCFSATNWS